MISKVDLVKGSQWEKCARLLSLNSENDLSELESTILTLLSNILSNRNDLKYREIKLANKAIQNRLLSKKGSFELMLALRFTIAMKNQEKVFIHDSINGIDENMVEWLMDASRWLSDTVTVCRNNALSRTEIIIEKGNPTRNARCEEFNVVSCADCIIQFRLPTSQTVLGGFFLSDTLRDVLSYAQCYFIENKKDDIILRWPESSNAISGDGDLDRTVLEANLGPRATLIVSTLSDAQRTERMQQKMTKAVLDNQQVAQHAVKLRSERIDKAMESKTERQKILQTFREDHEKKSSSAVTPIGIVATTAVEEFEVDSPK